MDKTPKERIVFDEGVYYGTDDHDGKDDLQLHMIPSEMHIPSQNDHHRAPSLSDIAAETRAASAAMETNIASRIDRERDAR